MAATNTSPIEAGSSVITVNTADLAPAQPQSSSPAANADPAKKSYPGTDGESSQNDAQKQDQGVGIEGEDTIWESSYSKRNFVGRIALRVVLTIAGLALAYYTWGAGHENMALFTWIALGALGLFWATLIFRMVQAHYSHYYRLTNRRIFVSSGLTRRRRDMMELLAVKDVSTQQQSLMERWLGVGTVVIVPKEKNLPTFNLAGVDDPKEVMDLIWHHARLEREGRAVEVNSV